MTRPAVPFLDLRAATAEVRSAVDAGYRRVLDSGRFLLGPETEAFEAEFAAYCGAAHCVTVGSGGAALELALRALHIGPGDEVVVPSHTFIATWLAVSATGAVPVPAEPGDPALAVADPGRIDAAVTPRTRAIVPVHLNGHPADIDAVTDVAERHGLAVVEDAAQAHGARYRGRRIGSGPHAAAVSFYPGKNLGALGDGGAVVTSDGELADRLRALRNYGARAKYEHAVRGTNSRLDEFQAAVLRAKLPLLDDWNARRSAVARRYLMELADVPGLGLPRVAPWARPVWHLFPVRHARRDALRVLLAERGVETQVHYPVPVHLSGAYAGAGWPAGSLPLAEGLAAELLSLPIGPHLSGGQVSAVVDAVRAATAAAPSPPPEPGRAP
ncbi:DegT/DnrJ/EryC1/StrS family aminotransferase [Nocardiopsis sediminis]|uniref:DegT/DnrJ/EryC1/StrS family aminotransferase n=1 Tax=Nocardiopsis sediminis TaxID=1778267 RepID=A0ABV8FG38_9ACTN